MLMTPLSTSAAQEERFTRKKHDAQFPKAAVDYCLGAASLSLTDLDYVVFYDKPLLKFERLLETYLASAPKGFRSFVSAMPLWLKEKLYLKQVLRKELARVAECSSSELPQILFTEHHQAHAASAFFPSPFERAAVLCMDGVGEWTTTSLHLGNTNKLTPQWEINFPHSLGLLYSAFTYYAGFKVNSGEYKLMGLAPYGKPKYVDRILDHLIDLKPDGSFRLNMEYFNFTTGLTMTNKAFDRLFGGPPRKAESAISQREMDIARSIQEVTEEVVLRLGQSVFAETGERNLCLAGGVALNCVANGRLSREGPFDSIWIQPAAGDAGGALGAALSAWYEYENNDRSTPSGDAMAGSYLGPQFDNEEVTRRLNALGAKFNQVEDPALLPQLANLLADKQVLGWMQGRMEFGPRALGGRSILGDARSTEMQSVMNLKIKYRESFRPFAPAILAERARDYFDLEEVSPYMLMVAPVKESLRLPMTDEHSALQGLEQLNAPRSAIPAVTHVDYSARVQTVHAETNARFHALLRAFEEATGNGILVNTSFNIRGEPIVCTPEDAYRCFMSTEMDYLVIENCFLSKAEQPAENRDRDWIAQLAVD